MNEPFNNDPLISELGDLEQIFLDLDVAGSARTCSLGNERDQTWINDYLDMFAESNNPMRGRCENEKLELGYQYEDNDNDDDALFTKLRSPSIFSQIPSMNDSENEISNETTDNAYCTISPAVSMKTFSKDQRHTNFQNQIRTNKDFSNTESQDGTNSLVIMTTRLQNEAHTSERKAFRGRKKKCISQRMFTGLAKCLGVSAKHDAVDLLRLTVEEIVNLRAENARLRQIHSSKTEEDFQICNNGCHTKNKKRKSRLICTDAEMLCIPIVPAESESGTRHPEISVHKIDEKAEPKTICSDLGSMSVAELSLLLANGSLPPPAMLSALLRNELAKQNHGSSDAGIDHSRCA